MSITLHDRDEIRAAVGCSRTIIHETHRIYLCPGEPSAENIAARFGEISDEAGQSAYANDEEQVTKFITKAAQAAGDSLAPKASG